MRRLMFVLVSGLCACSGSGPADGEGGPGGGGGEAEVGKSQRVLRRLTRFEYDNTLSDLLGIQSTWGQGLPPEDVVLGFDNNAAALRVGPLLLDKLAQAADEIADATDPRKLAACSGAADEACARAFIDRFGRRALRRPLDAAEQARYLTLYRGAAAAFGFDEGVRTVLSALLQSPHFLYRTELGRPQDDGTYRLTPYEVAAELSYLVTASTPDEELLAAAAADALRTPEQLGAQLTRLLRSDRAKAAQRHFMDQWLSLDRLPIVSKDAMVYPELTAALRGAMRAEAHGYFNQVLASGKVPELLSAPYKDINGVERAGLLTLSALLTVHATSHSSSPVHRGKVVRERLLCQPLPPPPAGVVVQLPAVDPRLSTRERFAAHSKEAACAGCHRLMDPIGLGFEGYDGIGRPRAMEAGRPVDDQGEVFGAGAGLDGAFRGVPELAQRLAGSQQFQDCFALQWFRYGFGVDEKVTEETRGAAAQAGRGFQASDKTFPALLRAVLALPRFTVRAADEGVTPPGPGTPPPVDMGGGGPPPPDMATPPGSYQAMVHRDSDWAAGYCSTVTVTNTGTQSGDWAVTLDVEGTINNLWNAVSTGKSGKVDFSGMSYNKTLAPGANTSFGFCAQK